MGGCYDYPGLQNEKAGTSAQEAETGVGAGRTAAEPTFLSAMFILLPCHQILFLEKSIWYLLQKLELQADTTRSSR